MLGNTSPIGVERRCVCPALDFRAGGGDAGHFGRDEPFPLARLLPDNPLRLRMRGNIRLEAIPALPLAEALDFSAQ